METHQREYTTVEAAAILGLHRGTVRHRLITGHLRGRQVGPGLWLIPASEIERAHAQGKLPTGRRPDPNGVRARRRAARAARAAANEYHLVSATASENT